MRYERLGQRKWAQVVRGERHVPAEGVLGSLKLIDTGIVYNAYNGKTEFCDLSGCIPYTSNIR
jgi:hypothetical protein